MATRAPLTVTLCTPDTSQAFDARDVQYSKSWRGGHKDATITLSAPLNFRHPMLSPFARIRIDDNRTAKTVWEGYLEMPGKTRSDQGDVWQIDAVGGYARLSDRRKIYIVIDRSFAGWEQTFATTRGKMTAGTGALPAGNEEGADCLLLQWQNGMAVANTDRVTMQYNRLRDADQQVGGFSFTHREGFASTVQRTQIVTRTSNGGPEEIARDMAWVTGLTAVGGTSAGGTAFPVGRDVLKLRIYRDGGSAQNTDTENWWAGLTEMRVTALRSDITGTVISGQNTYDNDYVLAHEVVIDMLNHFDPPIDKASASIDSTWDYQIDHMVYESPVTMQTVLDDLTLTHPDLVYEVLETNATGDHRFNLRALPDDVRYIATAEDGWSQPGGEADLRDEVIVSFRDRMNRRTSRTYTTDVPELDQWGITRMAQEINLRDEISSGANADRIGEQVLAQVSTAPESGTLTVARPIVDLYLGRDVQPWEIEPGYRIIIPDVDITAQPITEVTYDDSEATATLVVGEPALTDEQVVNIYAQRLRRRG